MAKMLFLTEKQNEDLVVLMNKVNRLEEKCNQIRWMLTVLRDDELELILDSAISLASQGLDLMYEPCQTFYRKRLTYLFTKMLNQQFISYEPCTIEAIFTCCVKLVTLIVIKLGCDSFPVYELLELVFNPKIFFHDATKSMYFRSKYRDKISPKKEFASTNDSSVPRGYLVELLNHFGRQGGFNFIRKMFDKRSNQLPIKRLSLLLHPFSLCYELLTVNTIEKYFLPVAHKVPEYLENFSDEELRLCPNYFAASTIFTSFKILATRLPKRNNFAQKFEFPFILRLLRIFHCGPCVMSVLHRLSCDEVECLSPKQMAKWLKENEVLNLVLRGSRDQPKCIPKLEPMLRLFIDQKVLDENDLNLLWSTSSSQNKETAKSVHTLLTKLAGHFTKDHLDHLYSLFQSPWKAWVEATEKKQRGAFNSWLNLKNGPTKSQMRKIRRKSLG